MAMCDGASSRGLRRRRQSTWGVVSLCILMSAIATNAFGPQLPLVLLGSEKAPKQSDRLVSSSALYGSSNLDRRSISGGGSGSGGGYPFRDGKSKRQERVGQLVQTELSRILHTGIIKGDVEYLADALRCRISVVRADVSPDLRQARISVSVRPKGINAKVPNSVATVGQPEPLQRLFLVNSSFQCYSAHGRATHESHQVVVSRLDVCASGRDCRRGCDAPH
jgi:hypothetical protein